MALWKTPAEQRAAGRARRDKLPRTSQARWEAPLRRADPLALIEASNEGRLPELVPLKMGRMAVSPFSFFRGAAPVMAADLATLPVTGFRVQICGDAHVQNLGAFAAADGHLVFDLNDFDETIPGPWEWDLKRLAASFVLAGREAGDGEKRCAEAVSALVRSYREAMEGFADMTALDLSRVDVTRYAERGPVHAALARAERASSVHALEKLTVRARLALRRFHDRPPLLKHVPERTARHVLQALRLYRDTLPPDRQLVLDAYRPHDVAFKVVGTGSVGTRDYVVLLFGRGADDPLVLQVKEEMESCYARHLNDVPRFRHQGRRVAEGQHRMQTASDPFLGWTSLEGRDYLVRQLCDHKAKIETAELHGEALVAYAVVAGEVLAKGHARTGSASAIAGYCGATPRLDKALATFASAYADQTTLDHERLVKAIRSKRIKAVRGPS
ncbi:MAG: DUF2252 domain-containing protein [Vicinamibacteria bacterium]